MSDQEKMATNISIRASVDGINDILGNNGAKILFRDAGLSHIYETPPDYNWEPCMTIPDQAKIYTGVADLVGLNGAIGIWRRIGYTTMKYADEIGHVMDAYKDHEGWEKFQKVMELFCAASGKGKIVVHDDGSVAFDCFDCLLCVEYRTGVPQERAVCSLFEGVVQYAADFAWGKRTYSSREIKCMAKGDDTCYFVVEKRD